ncbi:MAG: hypothetical protein RR238_05800 [Lachnospiraceae bacterium]
MDKDTNQYGTEPADLKLLAIRLSRKIWIVIVVALWGGMLFGAGYFIKHVVMAPEPQYKTDSLLYVDFVEDEDLDGKPKYYTYNEAGWAGFVKTDTILDKAIPHLTNPLLKEELRASVEAKVDSDYRFVELTVTHPKAVVALDIAHAMEQAFTEFAGEMQEIEQIRVMTRATEPQRVLIDTHTWRAALWGMILASVALILFILVKEVLNDAIYVPLTFEKRYGIPMLGAIVEKGDSNLVQITHNLDYLRRGQHLALVSIRGNSRIDTIDAPLARLAKEVLDIDAVYTPIQYPEQMEDIRTFDGVILEVPAGIKNGALIEDTLSMLKKHDCSVVAALLTHADAGLLRAYYFGMKG